MIGYSYGDENSSTFTLVVENGHKLLMGTRSSSGAWAPVKLGEADSTNQKIYRVFTLGANNNGSPTTETGNNESSKKYLFFSI